MIVKTPILKVLTPPISMTLTGLLLVGCASTPPPYEQMASAKVAVQDADNAGARTHAPLQMRTANKKLAEAKQAFDSEQYDRARRLADEAEVDARLAFEKSLSAKAQQAVAELRESIRTLKAEIDRARKR